MQQQVEIFILAGPTILSCFAYYRYLPFNDLVEKLRNATTCQRDLWRLSLELTRAKGRIRGLENRLQDSLYEVFAPWCLC